MGSHKGIQIAVYVLSMALLWTVPSHAQFADCTTGLLQMPTAEMPLDGTFIITNNWLNRHALPDNGWGYDTFQYGLGISFWNRFEVGIAFTLFDGRKTSKNSKYWKIMRNQDRHLFGRLLLLREGEFGWDWMPSLVFGMSDPVTGAYGDYLNGSATEMGNGYFNRTYLVASKHFSTSWGRIGAHAGYQYSVRLDYQINGPCAGVNWKPVWLLDRGWLDSLDLVAEYDSRTVNLGCIASVWGNRFEAMFELQNFQWVNFGLRYKLRLKQ